MGPIQCEPKHTWNMRDVSLHMPSQTDTHGQTGCRGSWFGGKGRGTPRSRINITSKMRSSKHLSTTCPAGSSITAPLKHVRLFLEINIRSNSAVIGAGRTAGGITSREHTHTHAHTRNFIYLISPLFLRLFHSGLSGFICSLPTDLGFQKPIKSGEQCERGSDSLERRCSNHMPGVCLMSSQSICRRRIGLLLEL